MSSHVSVSRNLSCVGSAVRLKCPGVNGKGRPMFVTLLVQIINRTYNRGRRLTQANCQKQRFISFGDCYFHGLSSTFLNSQQHNKTIRQTLYNSQKQQKNFQIFLIWYFMLLACDNNTIMDKERTAEIITANTTGMNIYKVIYAMSTTRTKINYFLLIETTQLILKWNLNFDRKRRGFRNNSTRYFKKC